ncbi:uncharacterized protein LOC131667130 [Phymastichus coffea]|uniref:uncharacterized protein LOC131667130 n=1 Tax=Phymastichus coffea TaxID=108790 RepID=UPI00273B8BC4|nr:uncharacterized protein LOC131667130 [Phymastichus coffea]
MTLKLFLFQLLVSVAIQAFPSEPKTVTEITSKASYVNKTECNEKLIWYQDMIKKVQKMFIAYMKDRKQLIVLNIKITGVIKTKHREFHNMISKALNKLKKDETITNRTSHTIPLTTCIMEIELFRRMNQNLTKAATNIKTNMLNFLDASGVPKKVRNHFNDILSKIVNFLYLTNLIENVLKDEQTLLNDAIKRTKKGIAYDKTYEISEDGDIVESSTDISDEYREVLEENEEDRRMNEEISRLQDDSDIKIAEAEALSREDERINELDGNDNILKYILRHREPFVKTFD